MGQWPTIPGGETEKLERQIEDCRRFESQQTTYQIDGSTGVRTRVLRPGDVLNPWSHPRISTKIPPSATNIRREVIQALTAYACVKVLTTWEEGERVMQFIEMHSMDEIRKIMGKYGGL